MSREYYKAYDDRYRQVHSRNMRWFTAAPSPIVAEVMAEYGISKKMTTLEIGCGEGRDAAYLLSSGFDVLATDVSEAAIGYCREAFPESASRFQVLDCLKDSIDAKFDFIYAVAVIHMLVPDEDRNGFYSFVRSHLRENGIALVCTMGDGMMERQSDISTAFTTQQRRHEESGQLLQIAGTSCRMVSFDTFRRELRRNRLEILSEGLTSIEPDFSCMMYAVVKSA